MAKELQHVALASWYALNDEMKTADEELCAKLLKQELEGKGRKQFVYRIHSRINKIRADRERAELAKQLGL